jgi:mannose-6-phosphate isomerase
MFVAITNTPRDYAWGSSTALADLLGTTPSGAPEAELWLGTHPASPSRTPDGLLSDLTTLPFLLKVLAAESPLSLQAHPTTRQAAEGFARENALGLPLDAPHRNYRDALHKPELIFALTPLTALCGFRPVEQTLADLALLGGFDEWRTRLADGIGPTFEWLISRGPGVPQLLNDLVAACATASGPHFSLVGQLARAFPGDPGIAISLMLNLATLEPGQVLFLPAGNIHAYIQGIGVELMAASDNVLRGGLTAKHVDVAELLSVLDFTPTDVPYLAPVVADGVSVFRPLPDFQLMHLTAAASVSLAGEALLLCTSGAFTVNGVEVARGDAFYVADEPVLEVEGAGQLFVATAG